MTRARGPEGSPIPDENAVRGISPRKPVTPIPLSLPIPPEQAIRLMEAGVDPASRAWSERNGCKGDGPTIEDCEKSGFLHPHVYNRRYK